MSFILIFFFTPAQGQTYHFLFNRLYSFVTLYSKKWSRGDVLVRVCLCVKASPKKT